MTQIYSEYGRAKVGWFFGLTGWQLATLAVGSLPCFWAVRAGAWRSVAVLTASWVVLFVVVVVPVRGRSMTGWASATARHAVGGAAGWTRFRSRASHGRGQDLNEVDLPGMLQSLQIHDGPPQHASSARTAVIQNHACRTWAVTASVVHPGIGMSEADERDLYGTGLAELLNVAARTELVDEVLVVVRTVPEDGAERDQWVARHRRGDGPALARRVNDEMQEALTVASVRTEQFVTLVVPEARLAKPARESGGGLDGRARVLYGLMVEVEDHLRGGLGMTTVTWLTSPELAVAWRTGFAPGDRAGIVAALAAREHDPGVNAEVPWAMAGPSGADPTVRHYSHDAWNSVSVTVTLPAKGAVMGALAPVVTPTEPGERRSLLVAYPILRQQVADRQTATGEWAADLGDELRVKAKVKQRARARADADQVRSLDDKLAAGNALTRPYAVCTVTVPKTARVAEFGRRLDASVRRAGFAPLRLDLAQDVAFAAAALPLGVSLTQKGDA